MKKVLLLLLALACVLSCVSCMNSTGPDDGPAGADGNPTTEAPTDESENMGDNDATLPALDITTAPIENDTAASQSPAETAGTVETGDVIELPFVPR